METLTGNKLIAEFMGYKFNAYPELKYHNITRPNETEWVYGSWILEDFNDYIINRLPYHSDWNWLMPVVEKIESLGYYTNILSADNNNKAHTMHIALLGEEEQYTTWVEEKKKAVWLAVINFINQYNSQTPQP